MICLDRLIPIFKLFLSLSPFALLSLGQVLKFDAYFMEEVAMSPEENYRIRQVGLYYYLEDDSMCIIEPKVKNSGLLQGKLMKRHRVPKNEHGDFYHWKDLNLGINLTIYGRTYRLVNCDCFTKVCVVATALPEILLGIAGVFLNFNYLLESSSLQL